MDQLANILTENTENLANEITLLHFKHNPDLLKRYGSKGKKRCFEDAVSHIEFLTEALKMDYPGLYVNYITWVSAVMKARNIPDTDLLNNLEYLLQAVKKHIGKEQFVIVSKYVALSRESLNEKKSEPDTYFLPENPLKKEAENYLKHLLEGKRNEASQLIHELVAKGVSVRDIYQYIFQVSQYEIGILWQCNTITVAHEHYCTAATQLIMSGLYPYIFSTKRVNKTMVACSLPGELHEMGIRMVADFFEIEGWDTYYLGTNMPDSQISAVLKEQKALLLAISATLPTNVSKVTELIRKIRSDSELTGIKILVGGYPFLQNPGLWEKSGADGCAVNAELAIEKAHELMEK